MKVFNKIRVATHNACKKGEIILDENGPKWAIFGGAALLMCSTVIACRQTLKAETIIEEHKKREEAINTVVNDDIYKGEYTVDDAKKDIVANYLKTGAAFIKLYRAPLVLSAVGLAGIFWGTNKLDTKVRNLTVTVAAISEALDQYRKRVANAVGEEAENDIYLGTDVSKVDVLDENGKKITKAEQVIKKNDADKLRQNPYIHEFGPQNWDGTTNGVFDRHAPSYNILTVKRVERDAQRDLELFGQVWWRDICKQLGMKCPAIYATAGWVVERDENGELYAPIGDSKVDFGLISDVNFYCDKFDLSEEEAGIALANPIFLKPNCLDIRDYLYTKEKKKFNIVK